MANPIKNETYTDLWVKNFSQQDVERYNSKWFNKFEKNTKHLEQVEVIKKYLNHSGLWLDAPVGSGRFYFEIRHEKSKYFALDNSSVFLKYVKRKFNLDDNNIYQRDLYDLNIKNIKFDFISCFNTLFALDNIDLILKNFYEILKNNGILVFDVKLSKNKKDKHENTYNQFTENEIINLTKSLNLEIIEIINHDFFDSFYFNKIKNSNNYIVKGFFKVSYSFLNLIYKVRAIKNVFLFLQKMNLNKEKMIIICRKM